MTARHPTIGGKGRPATNEPPHTWKRMLTPSLTDLTGLARRGPETILTPQMIIDIVADMPRDVQMQIIAKIIEAQK